MQPPRTRASVEKYEPIANNPEALDRLAKAYEVGSEHAGARDWYAMGQLEDAYQQELGKDLGGLSFKYNFANPMAATTGGADPRSNLRMAMYGNFLRERGLPVPEASYDFPYPIGGRFAGGNMEMYAKAADRGDFVARNNPKRFNFAGNFMGHSDRATIDEQMSGLWDPSYKEPPGPSYGAFEAALGDVARKYGVDPMNLQDVAWAGAKLLGGKSKGYVPSPMIEQINQMVERTARLTGVDPDEAFNDIFIRHGPGYAEGGLA